MYYIGLDVHKLSISYCIKLADGQVVSRGKVKSSRQELTQWAKALPQPWIGGMEATIFSHWIFYHLQPFSAEMRMGHPAKMKAISGSKKKSDDLDAETIADLLRCNLLPAVNVLPKELVELRTILRYRSMLVTNASRAKNKISGLLLESGVEYDIDRLHGKKYFSDLLKTPEVPAHAKPLLRFTRSQLETLQRMDRHLMDGLSKHPQLADRVKRLSTINGVGPVMALTWALEVGPAERLGSVSQAVSYCGLTAAFRESAGKAKRGPISKQRNARLQTVLVEAAQLAPHWNPLLAQVKAREEARGHKNRATLAVARKLVAYLMAADRGHTPRLVAAPPAEPSGSGG